MAERDHRHNGRQDDLTPNNNGSSSYLSALTPVDRINPPVASARHYMQNALPTIYQEDDFSMRFVTGFERTLDPILAILDSLHAVVDPNLAPKSALNLLSSWMGIELDESQPIEQHRLLVRNASVIWRGRGTARGLALSLGLTFPDLSFRIEDPGSAVWASNEEELGPQTQPSNRFDVFCEPAIDEKVKSRIVRHIEEFQPAHMSFRLHVNKESS